MGPEGFVTFIVLLFASGVAAGYGVRGFIGKEITKAGAELAQIHAKATVELANIVKDIKAKL